jgi:hypothetical protein
MQPLLPQPLLLQWLLLYCPGGVGTGLVLAPGGDRRDARDLVRTSFMDSSALHLIGALRLRTSEQGGALVVVVATCGVRRLLGVTPPPRDALVALARSRRGAAITNRRLSPHICQTVAA